MGWIAHGGPVTSTDEPTTCYYMIISEAVELVLQAGSLHNDGEVFGLDRGDPVKIVDLVRDIIRFTGFEPDVNISIEIIGARPGENS